MNKYRNILSSKRVVTTSVGLHVSMYHLEEGVVCIFLFVDKPRGFVFFYAD